jgi:Ca-activated chloride channel family protein
MFRNQRCQIVALVALVAASVSGMAWGQAKPITEKQLITLVETGFEEAAITERIEKQGLAFDADETTIGRLKEANISETLLKAIQTAAASKRSKPAAAGKTVITYDRLLILLETGVEEGQILKILERSPTIFTLSAEETAELKKAGASEQLLKALAGERTATVPPQPKATVTDFAIVFDCSASMNERTADGPTKMEVAKKVVAGLVNKVPDGLNLTFVIYGHDKQLNCQAVKILRPLGRLDAKGKADLVRSVQALKPVGNTPIALALRTAGKELSRNNAFSGMVLVSDGKETCNGNPTAEAATLAKNPKLSFGIQVVGFDVTPEERRSLEEIATAGEGKYFNAQTSDELVAVLDDIARQLAEAATPPKVVTGGRVLRINAPTVNMPEMGEIFIAPTGFPLNTIKARSVRSIAKYGEDLRLPSASEYDVIFVPKEGMHIRLIQKFSIADRVAVEIKLDDYAGMVRVEGEGPTKGIFVAPAGSPMNTAANYAVQKAKSFGETMIVPKGEYDVYVNGELFEEKLTVEAGAVQVLK